MNTSSVLGMLSKGLERLVWATKHTLGVAPQSAAETYARLSWFIRNKSRYTPGYFRLPFGMIQYVDGRSLKSQYSDIFVQKTYDFQAERTDPTILDCGGNIGLSVIRFKQQYPQSQVTVFEADPLVANVLCANLADFNLTDVEVVRAAVWTRAGQVSFASDGADSGRITDQPGERLVTALRLADFVTQPIDLLKLDVEGAEYAIIKDLCETGKIGYVRRLICEVHGRYVDKGALEVFLRDLSSSGFLFTLARARCAPDLPGEIEPTPFAFARDGKFLLNLYAWQPRRAG